MPTDSITSKMENVRAITIGERSSLTETKNYSTAMSKRYVLNDIHGWDHDQLIQPISKDRVKPDGSQLSWIGLPTANIFVKGFGRFWILYKNWRIGFVYVRIGFDSFMLAVSLVVIAI